jgi:hypothetical protein
VRRGQPWRCWPACSLGFLVCSALHAIVRVRRGQSKTVMQALCICELDAAPVHLFCTRRCLPSPLSWPICTSWPHLDAHTHGAVPTAAASEAVRAAALTPTPTKRRRVDGDSVGPQAVVGCSSNTSYTAAQPCAVSARTARSSRLGKGATHPVAPGGVAGRSPPPPLWPA